MSCFAKGIPPEFNPDVPMEIRLHAARAVVYAECALALTEGWTGATRAMTWLFMMWATREAKQVQHWLYTEAHESAEAFWACPDCKELLR